MHVEKLLLPYMEWLVRKPVWTYSELPVDLKPESALESLRDYGWIDLRLVGPDGDTGWTQTCDLCAWIRASRAEAATILKIRVSQQALLRLDELVLLALKQANNDWFLRRGAGRPVRARTVPPAMGAGSVSLSCSLVRLTPRTCWGPTRTGTSISRHHEANSTPQRAIHWLPDRMHAA